MLMSRLITPKTSKRIKQHVQQNPDFAPHLQKTMIAKEKIDPKKAFGLFPRCMTTMKMCEERGIEYLPMDELEDLAKKYEVHLKWQYFSDQPYFKVETRVV